MKRIILLAYLLFTFFEFQAQEAYHNILSGTRFFNGRQAFGVTEAYKGDGYVVMSKKGHWSKGYTVYLVAYDACDNIVWEKDLDIIQSCGIIATQDGYIMHGIGRFTQSGSSYAGQVILKLDTLGNVLSTFSISDYDHLFSGDHVLDFRQIDSYDNGDYYVAGQYVEHINPTVYNMCVVKFDRNSDVLWSRIYPNSYSFLQGHYSESIATSDGGVLIYGLGVNNINKHVGCLLKLDSLGDIEWAKRGVNLLGHISKPLEVGDGYILGVNNEHNFPDGSSFLVKIDLKGNVVWTSDVMGKSYSQFAMSYSEYSGNIICMAIERRENSQYFSPYSLIAEYTTEGKLIKKAEFRENPQGNVIGIRSTVTFNYYHVLMAPFRDTTCGHCIHIWKGSSIDDFISCGFQTESTTYPPVSVSLEDISFEYESINTFKRIEATDFKDSTIVVNSLCSNSDPLPSIVDIGNDTTVCKGDLLALSNKYKLPYYNWSTGENSATIEVQDSGKYILKIDYGCVKMSDTIHVSFFPEPEFGYRIEPENPSTRDTVKFISLSEEMNEMRWEFQSQGVYYDSLLYFTFNQDGRYLVRYYTVDKYGCVRTEKFYLDINTPELPIDLTYDKVFIPSSFTPNADNINDEFKPFGEIIDSYEMLIFNRWGDQIAGGRDISWSGSGSPQGAYLFKIILNLKTGEQLTKDGYVYLIR